MLSEKECLYWLVTTKGIGVRHATMILDIFGNASSVFYAEEVLLQKLPVIRADVKKELVESRREEKIKKSYKALTEKGICLVGKGEKGYPEHLGAVYDAPVALFFRGRTFPEERHPRIAIVGARNCSYYGKSTAEKFARVLSESGVEIVSGLARGVDSAAQSGAMKGGTPTFSVLGCGIDLCYPRENERLYQSIINQGGIYSEYGPGVSPRAGNFPMRNRIISGISDGILVVEARKRSGSLITADYGLEQGKNVYAVPGRLSDELSEGCNHLISQGAMLAETPEDILKDLEFLGKIIQKNLVKKRPDKKIPLETREKIVYANLSLEPKHVNQISMETGLTFQELMGSLLFLEKEHYIKEISKNYYVLCEGV